MELQGFPKEWNVIPLPKDSKIPIFKWRAYQKERFPELEIQEGSNYAAICGKISNNLLILDVDLKAKNFFGDIYGKFKDSFPELCATRIVITPHGYHFYYYMRDFSEDRHKNSNARYNKNNKFVGATNTEFAEYLKGFDILGNNGYAVIPPSKIGLLKYENFNELPIRDITEVEYKRIKKFFLKDKPISVRQPFLDILNGKIEIESYASKTHKDEPVYWKMLFREVYHFCGLLPQEIFKGLKVNQPAFDEGKTIQQLKYPYHDYHGKPFSKERIKEYFPEYYRDIGDIFGTPTTPTTIILKDLNVKQLTDYLVNTLEDEFDIIALNDSLQLMVKEGNYYSFNLDNVFIRLEQLVRELSKGSYKTYKSNVKEILADRNRIDRKLFCVDGSLINFQNGIYNILKERFYPIGERNEIFFYCVPHDYLEGDFKCPNFKRAINQWLIKDKWPTILYSDLFEMIGLCFSTNTGIKKAFLSFGPTDSGKTQMLNLVIYIVGVDNSCSVKLHRLTKNEFGSKRLQMKLLNACGEIPKYKLKLLDLFKELTGDDAMIPCEIKGGESFEFKNYAKFWFNANDIPPLAYIDDAFFGRFILVEFPNQFENINDDFILQFWQSLIDPNEIQAIIHESLKGLKRLIERKGFRNEIQKNTKHIWLWESDPVYRFLKEFCNIKKGVKILKDELYEIFNEVSSEYMTDRAFSTELQKYGIYKRQLRSGGKRPYFYVNVELKSEEIEEDKKEGDLINEF